MTWTLVWELSLKWIGITETSVPSASKIPGQFYLETVGINMCTSGWCTAPHACWPQISRKPWYETIAEVATITRRTNSNMISFNS